MPVGKSAWALSFEISPIILVNGLVADLPFGILPLVAITEAANFPLGLLSNANPTELHNFFAHWRPLPGATLISQDIGRYPMANQAVAANSTITQPQVISMEMLAPAKGTLGYYAKTALMMALREALYIHNNEGGTYIVATPSFIYTNCLLLNVRDTSHANSNQPQNSWQFDFERPLITLDQAAAAQSSMINRITRQTKINGNPAWSGLQANVGQPGSVGGASLIPSAVPGSASGTAAVGPFL